MEKIRAIDLEPMVMTPEVSELVKTERLIVNLADDDQHAEITVTGANGEEWIRFALRTREFDGPDWLPTKLARWKYTSHTDLFVKEGGAVEHSKHFSDPRTPLTEVYSRIEAAFIEDPFANLVKWKGKEEGRPPSNDHLFDWLELWKKVASSDHLRYPGLKSDQPIKGLSEKTLEWTRALLSERGIAYLTTIPTWLYVGQINKAKRGFNYADPKDASRIQAISDRIPQRTPRELIEASWIVVLQYWNELAESQGIRPEDHVNPRHVLRDPQGKIMTYPLQPDKNLWQEQKIPQMT